MSASAFAPTNGEPHNPQNEKDRGRYPQEMNCESSSKEKQDKQQCKDQ
jgi:hypothetical protein